MTATLWVKTTDGWETEHADAENVRIERIPRGRGNYARESVPAQICERATLSVGRELQL
jgi:hypothetical protein